MATSKIKSFDTAVEQVSSSRSLEKEGIKAALSSGNLRKQKKTKKDKKVKEEKKNKKNKPKKSVSMVASIASTTPSPERSRTRQEGSLSHSSPTPTSSSSLNQPKQARDSAWSDADDEILEFVREETPADRTSSSATSSSSFSSIASTPKSKMKQKQKKKKNGNTKVKTGGGVVVLNNSKDALPTPTSVHDPAEARSRPQQQQQQQRLRDDVEFGWEIDKHDGEEEEDEEVEAAASQVFESKDDVEGDTTDNESGSCSSSRFGWQYKNDKLLAGRDWAEFYDNMRQHIVAGGPGREFLLLDEDAARVHARRSDADDFSCAVTPHNFQKNRYGNILPYNQSRVKLTAEEDQSNDYVNASWVKLDDVLPGFHDRITYIAASAPIASTVEDFYRMLWETETFGIVMLTRNVEEGRAKCHQYWPEESETQRHGSFTVTNAEEVVNNKLAFVIRRLVLQNSKSGEQREVTQYHYLAWPDHGVPDSSEPLEEIIKLINAQAKSIGKTAAKEPTLVAHCSAGIGRTGAFILIHALLNYIFQEIVEDDEESLTRWATRAPPTLDFVHMVQHMRNQRSGMIAQPEQYAFCYQTVLGNLGRALRYSPHKWDTTSPSAKESRAATATGGRRAMTATPTRQKSCTLF